MLFSRKYSRNFIPLNQESSACNIDLRPCMGRCIIEIKNNEGKLSVALQGLKPNTFYKVGFLSLKGNDLTSAYIGFIDIDHNGKGEERWNFNPENVCESGLKIEDFNVIAFILQDSSEIIIPLAGYIGNEIAWRDKYMYSLNSNNNNSNNNASNNNASNNNNSNNNASNNNNLNNGYSDYESLNDYEKGKLDEIKGTIDYRKGKLDEERGRLDYEKGKLDEERGKLDYKKGKLDEERGRLDYEKGKLDEERGKLDGDRARLNPADPNYEYNNGKIDEAQGIIDYKKGKIDEAQGNIDYKKGKIDEAQGNIDYKKGKIDEAQGIIDYKKGKLDELKGLLDYGAGKKEEYYWQNKNSTNNENNDITSENVTLNENRQMKYDELNDLINNFKKEMKALEESSNNRETLQNLDINYIKTNNAKMTPFSKDNNLSNYSWYRISPCELTILGENTWKYINNQFVFSCYKKYKHLMLGIYNKDNEEKYVIGIPCKFNKDFVARGELEGLNTFVPLDNNSNLYGYRLLYI